jgi:catechol 2,3-dioxygenase-like lactoylglutathione lyase family enzyme
MMAAADTLDITGIGQIAINCHDVKRATEFYRDKLGLRMLYEFPGLAFFDCGGVRLMLTKPETAELDHPSSIIYYRVADIQQATRAIADKGVSVENEPRIIARMPDHDLWLSNVRDTEGNIIAFMAEMKNA